MHSVREATRVPRAGPLPETEVFVGGVRVGRGCTLVCKAVRRDAVCAPPLEVVECGRHVLARHAPRMLEERPCGRT